MNKEITGVILAGGRGARMEQLTENEQKCMLHVDGKSILSHIFDNIHDAFGSVHIVVATLFATGGPSNTYQLP